MADGRYVYCIVDSAEHGVLEDVGLLGKPGHIVGHKDIGAVVSIVPYSEVEASIDNILAHQRMVEASRKIGTTLPVKFGTIFRKEDGVTTLLSKSYDDYRKKLTKLDGLDEFGVKVLFNKAGFAKVKSSVEETSPEVVKMRRSLAKAGEGKSYFTKLKMNEAIRSEAYRKMDELSREIHDDLVRNSEDSSILKSEHEQIVLNAAYLVRRGEGEAFLARASRLGKVFAEKGLLVHSSGPWAPYSFC
jgi:Gas vesicle synthesis protein GvpL/GvpF